MKHDYKRQAPKRVLIATDFSKNARYAAEYGISLFGLDKTEYLLFNSCGPEAESLNLLASINDILEINARKLLDKEVSYFKARVKNEKINMRSVLASGLANEAVLKAAREEDVDLILMGTNGANTLYSMIMGSTAAAVIQKTACPVLIIPGKPKFKSPTSIVYAADLKGISNYNILNPLMSLAEQYHSQLMILNVMNTGFKLEKKEVAESDNLEAYFNGYSKHTFHPIRNSDIEIGIEKFIESYEPDMLAMVTRNGLPEHRSLTQEMISRTKIPLLVMPDVHG